MSALLPEGIEHLGDAPYTLHHAITTALRILGYAELEREYQPPKRIWLDADKLVEHFEWVEEDRKAKFRGEAPAEDDYDGPVEENAVELIKRG